MQDGRWTMAGILSILSVASVSCVESSLDHGSATEDLSSSTNLRGASSVQVVFPLAGSTVANTVTLQLKKPASLPDGTTLAVSVVLSRPIGEAPRMMTVGATDGDTVRVHGLDFFAGTSLPLLIERVGRDGSRSQVGQHQVFVNAGAPVAPPPKGLGPAIFEHAKGYPQDGRIDYFWPEAADADDTIASDIGALVPVSSTYTGGTMDIFYRGVQVAGRSGLSADYCYCSGLTWELFLRSALLDRGSPALGGPTQRPFTASKLIGLRRQWYSSEGGASEALLEVQLGDPVAVEALQPGDFVQFWRNNKSGHSAVVTERLEDDYGNPIGIKYLSCQASTGGIGTRREYFGNGESEIAMGRTYGVRLRSPQEWGH